MHLGTSRAYITDYVTHDYWRVWARRADGHLVDLLESSSLPEPVWTDWGVPGGLGVGNQGIDATSWVSDVDQWEAAFYLTGNNVVEVRLKNRMYQMTAVHGPPPGTGKTLTGYFAVAFRDPPGGGSSGTPRPLVFVTVKDSPSSNLVRVYVLESVDGVGTWYGPLGAQTDYSPTAPLAASNTQDGLHSRVFASTTNGTLRSIHWNGAVNVVTLPPPAGKQVCGTVAAVEGFIGPQSVFRAYVFCTRRDAAESQLLFRFTTDLNGVVGWSTWGAIQLAGGATVSNTGYALAATTLGSYGMNGVDVYALSSTSRLLVARRTPTGEMPAAFSDLGDDGEYAWRSGGLAATPAMHDSPPLSQGFYIGNAQYSNRLYHRVGEPTLPDTVAANWTNHGSSTGRSLIVSNERVAENSTAFYRGRTLTAYLSPSNDVGVTNFTRARWSSDDGESYGASVELARGSDPLDPSSYVGHPSVGFTDTGKAYIALSGADSINDSCDRHDHEDSEIFLQTTTNGVNYSTPTRLQKEESFVPCYPPEPLQDYCPGDPAHPSCTEDNCGQPLDHCFCRECFGGPPCERKPRLLHPWVAIERRVGLFDRIHLVWSDTNPNASGIEFGGVRYVRATDPVPANPPTVLLTEFADESGAGDPREGSYDASNIVVTVGAGGVAYIGSSQRLCRIDTTTFDSCEALLVYDDGGPPFNMSTPLYANIPGTSEELGVGPAFSLVASPSDPDTVYYAFQRPENEEDTEYDVWFQIITFEPDSGQLMAGARIPLTDALDDDRHQFLPALTVVQDKVAGDTVLASWYDMRGPACAGSVNRCYRGKRSMLMPGMFCFGYTQDIPVVVPPDNPASDPHLLPLQHCTVTYDRSLGAYHHVAADRLHSFHTIVGAPFDGNPGTATLTRGWVSRGFWSW